MLRIALVSLLLLVSAPARAERACFTGPMDPIPLSSGREVIAGSGGVIVASGEAMPDWRFRAGNKIVRPHVVAVAPGLAIYHPPPVPGDEVVLENTDHQRVVTKKRAFTIEPPLDPPDVVSISTAKDPYARVTVTAVLSSKAPETALVAIVSRVERDRLVPITWAIIGATRPASVSLWHTPYSCDQTIPTSVEPRLGDRVVVSWLDDAGRVSEPSKPIVISGGSTRK